jgi:hypothetical protein
MDGVHLISWDLIAAPSGSGTEPDGYLLAERFIGVDAWDVSVTFYSVFA